MDTAPIRPQLPALEYTDAEKAKREEELYQLRHTVTKTPLSSSTAVSTEPTYSYQHGPHPYSHATQAAILAPNTGSELGTPPDSRRPSGEKDVATQPSKQSLPSISEALGVDNQTSYQTPLPTQQAPPPPLLPLQAPLHKSLGPSSPVPTMRAYAADPPQTHAEPHGPTYARSATPKYEARSLFSDVRPALHLSTNGPPPYLPGPGSTSYTHTTNSSSPVYERSQGSGPPSFTYGYTPYPPRYQSSGSSNAGPIYQPSSVTTAPSWKSDNSSRHQERSYGESVKRHLDLYDLESGLNDITSTGTFLGDFANRYANLLHQSPRSGPPLSMLPSIIEIEDMISKSRSQTESLIKIRETVLAQQAAHDQEAAEQRQQKLYGADMAPPHSSGDSDDGKSVYSGSDSKKRRGRAAPPGRCHSCNRAETPEWRRGPDGARTLCNACGLHYAKLTRKQNNAGKAGSMNSSNLRPKDHMQ
ncbi:hypothetical protein AMS68_001642 [Peltaster fructicola]|uniref:GATA-type domain-containing protein n=1 Tax=Peltaster fructicola TaxID=286661 RepID=A0A6H0XNB0_9PEZI|nr:hypothetical protein AMS68_001642 [Peltaster fructicola]